MDGFKLEGGGGELFKEGFRKLLKQEWNYLKKKLIRNSVCQNNNKKQQYQKKQSVVYTSKQQTKLNWKS